MTYKFRGEFCLRAHGEALEGSGVTIVGGMVIILDAVIWPFRFLSFTGVGTIVIPTARQIAIAIAIIHPIKEMTVPNCHLQFRIFQPLVTQCLHCPPDVILSTPKWDHIIGIIWSSRSGVYVGYCAKSTAMFWEHIQGLNRVVVELFGVFGSGDNWACPGVVASLFNVLSAGLQQSFVESKNGFCRSRRHVVQITSSDTLMSLYSSQVWSSGCQKYFLGNHPLSSSWDRVHNHSPDPCRPCPCHSCSCHPCSCHPCPRLSLPTAVCRLAAALTASPSPHCSRYHRRWLLP